MITLTDPLGHRIALERKPSRIVSLVPSQTELLFDLGLGNELVGRTKFCVNPRDRVDRVKQIGGTKSVHVDWVEALKPDLVIANKEENKKAHVASIMEFAPVYVSDVKDIPSALKMIEDLGTLTGREARAAAMLDEIKTAHHGLKSFERIKSLYLIWQKPYMTVGGDTFIHHMMEAAGFQNVAGQKQRYPQLSTEEIRAISPEIVLFSSEPFPFKSKHIESFVEKTGLDMGRCIIVDGEMFSWYGSRMRHAFRYMTRLRAEIDRKTGIA